MWLFENNTAVQKVEHSIPVLDGILYLHCLLYNLEGILFTIKSHVKYSTRKNAIKSIQWAILYTKNMTTVLQLVLYCVNCVENGMKNIV